jgi:peptidoglycan/LPS O-acetylase OafA/YrhL
MWPSHHVWFLQHLFVFCLIFAAARLHMLWICLFAAAILVVDYLVWGTGSRFFLTMHFFALGTLFDRANVSRLLAAPVTILLAVGLPLLATCAALASLGGDYNTAPSALLSYASVAYFLTVSAAIARPPLLARPIGTIGRNALEIYLLHLPLQLALCFALLKVGHIGSGDALFFVVLAGSILGAWVTARVMYAVGLGIFFRPPKRWVRMREEGRARAEVAPAE